MSSSFESTAPTPEELHELLPAYEILEVVASTPFKVIYNARQISLDRTVTIKLYLEEIVKDPEFAQHFEDVSKGMARLKHPNLINVFDFGTIENMLYIVMEHLPNRSLHDITQGAHLSKEEATQLILDISKGLELAHQINLVHEKITPENILINDEGTAKIVDFKINQSTEENPPTCYSAPETYSDTIPSPPLPSSDIYSLGIIFYELLTGSIPTAPYQPPSSIQQVLPEIDNIIARSIQPDPTQRYATITEMISDLNAVQLPQKQANTPVSTATAPAPVRHINAPTGYPATPKNPATPILMLIFLGLLGGGGYWFYTQFSKKTNQPPATTPATTPIATTQPSTQSPPTLAIKTAPVVPTAPILKKQPPPKKTPQITIIPNVPDKPVITPDTTPDVPAVPDFDVEAFISQTQDSLRQSKASQSTLKSYNSALLSNIKSFDRHIASAIRKIDRDKRAEAKQEAESAFESMREDGKIPKKLTFTSEIKARKIHRDALEDQKKITKRYNTRFTKLAKSYSDQLSRKASKLRQEGDTQNAKILQDEIDNTMQDPESMLYMIKTP